LFVHVLPSGCALRLFEEADADELFALVEANQEHLAPWMPWAQDPKSEETAEFLRTSRRQLADNDGLQAASIDAEGAIIGSIGFHGITWKDRITTIGYWLAQDREGRGTMTEAVRAMVDHAFGTWRLNRVELQTAPDNEPSRYVAQRLGFREEGLLRQAERFPDGYRDLVLYAVVAEDWYS
jgi:ribosomal-protein-serine acetyltransferase